MFLSYRGRPFQIPEAHPRRIRRKMIRPKSWFVSERKQEEGTKPHFLHSRRCCRLEWMTDDTGRTRRSCALWRCRGRSSSSFPALATTSSSMPGRRLPLQGKVYVSLACWPTRVLVYRICWAATIVISQYWTSSELHHNGNRVIFAITICIGAMILCFMRDVFQRLQMK